MRRLAFSLTALALLTVLSACTHNPIPDGYTGPRAVIRDTAASTGPTSGDIFSVTQVDGKIIMDSFNATRQANQGRGFYMEPIAVRREVPADQPITLTLVGRRAYGAPIMEMMRKGYEVTGELQFTPANNGLYLVKGVVGEGYSAVWLEDDRTGTVVGQKYEIGNPAAAAPPPRK